MIDRALLTHTTIWFALVGYAMGAAGDFATRSDRCARLARGAWTVGCALLVAHILCAFHFYHDWNHAAAVAETARQTREQIGVDSGWGVYVNYLFAAVWIADAAWWWVGETTRARRPRWLSVAVHAFLFFIVFNATIVFGGLAARTFGAIVCLSVVTVWVRQRVRHRATP